MRHYSSTNQKLHSTHHSFYQLLLFGIQSLLVLMIVLLYSSCNEDVPLQSEEILVQEIVNPHAKYLHEANRDNLILPRSTKYSINAAVEYLNDGMNFLYCRPDDFYEETVMFIDTFSISIDGSYEIEEDDLIDLMDNLAQFAGDHYWADGRLAKEPLMFNMKRIGTPSTYVDIEATFAMEAGGELGTDDEYPYIDSWIYGQSGQDVSDECSEEEANADAADLFRRDLRKNVVYRNKYDAYYFKNPFVVCFSGSSNNCDATEIPATYFPVDESYQGYDLINENDPTEDDNLFDYLVFYNHSGNSGYHTCLSDNEMNFHYESMADLAIGVLPSPVGNIVISQIEVGYEGLWGEETSTIIHSMLVVRATKTVIEIEEYEPATLLPCCP